MKALHGLGGGASKFRAKNRGRGKSSKMALF